jgi:hypothetical protein
MGNSNVWFYSDLHEECNFTEEVCPLYCSSHKTQNVAVYLWRLALLAVAVAVAGFLGTSYSILSYYFLSYRFIYLIFLILYK